MKKRISIWFFYGICFFMVLPILSYYLGFTDVFDYQGYVQVYFSGPVLAIIGIIIYFFYRKKIIGSIFFILGVWWIVSIINELANKL